MIGAIYRDAALIDSAAVLALRDPTEKFHREAVDCMAAQPVVAWASLTVTAHEVFTRSRYNGDDCGEAFNHFDVLRGTNINVVAFEPQDEVRARAILHQYSDHTLSFHDALCAAVMQRLGIYRIFTFDKDFLILGFELLPGIY